MNPEQLFGVLAARWKRALLLFMLCVGAAVAVSVAMPRKYTATAQVLIDAKSPDPVLGVFLPGQMVSGYMATQVDIVTSQRVALMVTDALKLPDNPAAIEQWREVTGGVGSIRHHFADLLLKGLEVKPARDSSLLAIGFTGTDPAFAALVANEFARAYVDLSVQLKVDPARQNRGFFDAQAQSLRDKLEDAQARLTAYQRDKGIISADERLDVENARLNDLSTQLVVAQAQAIESNKRQSLARDAMTRGASSDIPEVLSNPLILTLKGELAKLEARQDQQAAVLGANHPDILKLREERASIRSKIDKEMGSITASLMNAHIVQSQRESEIRASLDRQRARVLQIKQVRDELTVLQRDVESAQKAYDVALQRLSQTSMESQFGQANVVVLNAAVAPLKPSSPRPLLNVAIGTLAGAALAIVGSLFAELRGRRIRGPLDLSLASGVQPIGALRDAFRGRSRPGGLLGRRGRSKARSVARTDAPVVLSDRHAMGVETSAFAPTMFGALPEREEREPVFADTEPTPPKQSGGAAESSSRREPLGQIMVKAGLIHPPEVERILAWARQEGVRFGEAAVATRLATPEQVERALAYQFDYPVLQPGASGVSDEVVAAYDARNPFVADMRRLRARIRSAQIAAAPDAPLKALAVISSGSGDGKTFVCSNLAVTFSQMGQRTLLVDADLRRGRLHQLFGLPNGTGLSSMLNGRIGAGSLQRVSGLQNLTVLTCGPQAPNPSELLSREVFGHLLDSFTRSFDIVILDTPGVAEEPDATLVAQRAGAALVLARQHRSAFDAVVELVQSGGTARVSMLGSVLNQA